MNKKIIVLLIAILVLTLAFTSCTKEKTFEIKSVTEATVEVVSYDEGITVTAENNVITIVVSEDGEYKINVTVDGVEQELTFGYEDDMGSIETSGEVAFSIYAK